MTSGPRAKVIEVQGIVKRYPGASVNAVDGVSFSIDEGTCFGLLGPNGAGKTTTIEVMEGLAAADQGRVLYRGGPVGGEFRRRTGIQFQETALQENLTVREILRLFGSFYPEPADLPGLIRLCSLEGFADRNAKKLSGGQRQRLLLAVALVNDPDLLFLDEPTTGLDPQARRNFWDLVQSIKKKGKTILLTTHYMEEAYALCDRIAIMDRGRLIAQGSPDQLLKQHFDGVSIELPAEDFKLPPHEVPGRVFQKDGLVEIQTSQVEETLKRLLAAGSPLARIKVRSQTLEDLFLELTGRELRG